MLYEVVANLITKIICHSSSSVIFFPLCYPDCSWSVSSEDCGKPVNTSVLLSLFAIGAADGCIY
jgi:hypothetical protein